jgi:hypothetical protein
MFSLFVRLISHQPAILFSQNESATSNQPQPASSTLLSEQTSTIHQPPANRIGWLLLYELKNHPQISLCFVSIEFMSSNISIVL